MLHSTLEWKYNYSFNGDYFHTNDVANITLDKQKIYVTEEFRIMLGRN